MPNSHLSTAAVSKVSELPRADRESASVAHAPNLQVLELTETERAELASKKSRGNFGLDLFNICAADIRDGLGPYLTIFLLSKNWTPSAIGWALSTASFAALLATAPAGFLIDRVPRKRLVIALASIVIAMTTVGIWFSQSFWIVIALQVAMGLASALIGPSIAYLSRLIAGSEELPKRIGRNEIFNHAGNFAAASLSAALVNLYNVEWIFGLVIFMSLTSIFAIFRIPASKGFHLSTFNLAERPSACSARSISGYACRSPSGSAPMRCCCA